MMSQQLSLIKELSSAEDTLTQQWRFLVEGLEAQLSLADLYMKSTIEAPSEAKVLLAEGRKLIGEALKSLWVDPLPAEGVDVHEARESSDEDLIVDLDAVTAHVVLKLPDVVGRSESRSHSSLEMGAVDDHNGGTLTPSMKQKNGKARNKAMGTRRSGSMWELELAMERPCLWPVWMESEEDAPRLMKISATEILQDHHEQASDQPSWVLEGMASVKKGDNGTLQRLDSRYGDRNIDWLSHLVIPPSAMITLLVDFFSLVMITWDLLTLPLLAFEVQKDSTVKVINMVTSLYWAVELPIPFFVGYYKSTGKMELRFFRIAQRYLKSWFFPQLFLVLIDFCSLFLQLESGEAVSVFRSSRVFRVVKIARLARILKISNVMERLQGFTSLVISEMLQAVISLSCMSIIAGMGCHTLACLWYAIGTDWNDGTIESLATETDIQDYSGLYQYFVSFQWVWAQFTPAPPPPNMGPFNEREALFAIILRVAGLVFFSSFVGSVTAMIAQARKLMETRWKESMQMRLYFKDNSVKISLSMTILDFLNRKRQKRALLLEHEVSLLKNLPYTMLAELRLQVWGYVLAAHPLFMYLAHTHTPTLKQVCGTAITEKRAQAGEEILHYGMVADAMYFVRIPDPRKAVEEAVHYFAGIHVAGSKPTDTVLEGGWFGEPALWLAAHTKDSKAHHPWRQHGHALAVKECALVEVHGSRLREIVLEHPMALKCLQSYASEFISSLPRQLEQVNIVGSEDGAAFLLKRCYSAGNLPEGGRSFGSSSAFGSSHGIVASSPAPSPRTPAFLKGLFH
mmetsp:Transcript_46265/g.107593  ORF Transcript_46265/g.107593 Transcript_46265/m.107593 type:complete len:797 (+) Transcript_46265:121-2511(+)